MKPWHRRDIPLALLIPAHIQEEGITDGPEYQKGGDPWGPSESLPSTGMDIKMLFYKE